jgi:hypothetical protein
MSDDGTPAPHIVVPVALLDEFPSDSLPLSEVARFLGAYLSAGRADPAQQRRLMAISNNYPPAMKEEFDSVGNYSSLYAPIDLGNEGAVDIPCTSRVEGFGMT